jgi:hypothetical protein
VTQSDNRFNSQDHARETALAALSPSAVVPTSPAWDSFVLAMRLLLPAAALILGGITIAWPSINEREVSFTLSQEEVARSDGVIRMTNPRYVGTDAVDRLFRVSAASGQQDNANAPRIRLTDIHAEMALDPGQMATVQARTGIYRMKEGTLSLVGGVHVRTETGYALDMAGAEVDLKAHKATGQGTINGTSELGALEAGRMEIRVDEREGSFEGGVKLHIKPRRPNGASESKE